jgi:DNA ligase-1
MQAFFEHVVEQKCEGLMVKLLESGEIVVAEADDEDGEAGSEVGDGATPKRKKGRGKVREEGDEVHTKKGGRKKPLPATYEPDQRSMGWMKVKKGSYPLLR